MSRTPRPATTAEVAAYLKVSKRTVERLIADGTLRPYGKLGRAVRLDIAEVDAALKAAR